MRRLARALARLVAEFQHELRLATAPADTAASPPSVADIGDSELAAADRLIGEIEFARGLRSFQPAPRGQA